MGCSPSDSKVFIRREKTFHILHFNDVYNLTEKEKEPVGGASRFITAMQQFDNLEPMVLFSGDIYSPSKLSQTMRGMHMVPFLQKAKVTAACVGNHDLDFGIDRFKELKKETEFPWLLTNVFVPGTKNPIGHATDHLIVHHKGIKIGMIGVAEEEWLTSIISLNKEDYEFQDFISTSKQWVDILREKG
jgi:5'-nucleotidase